MTSLVTELQREALDRSVPAADLLRKALVAARKLKIEGIQSWLKSELNGYSNSEEIPEYRSVHGEIKALNPYNGLWMPIMFPDRWRKCTDLCPIGSVVSQSQNLRIC